MTYVPNNKSQEVGFVTTSNLGIGGVFTTSPLIDASGFTQVQTEVLADQDGTIDIRFCSDLSGTDTVRSLSIPYVAANGYQLYSAPAFVDFIEYKFTNTSGVGQTDFYFATKLLSEALSPQSLRLDAFLAPSMVSNVSRSVIVGEGPNGVFQNQLVGGVAFRTEALLGIAGVYTSPVTDVQGYSQIETHLFSDVEGTLVGRWYNDEAKTTLIRTFTRPYSGDEVGTTSYFSSPKFGPYLEYEYTNGGTGQASFFLDFHTRTQALSGQVLGMNDFIPGGVVANLGRNVLVGQDENDVFGNVSVTTTTNDAGSYNNLNVVSGARPSQLAGRVKVSEVVDTAVSVLQRTVTSGKTFFVTDLLLTVDNTDNSNSGRINLRDGITVAGAIVLPLQIQESPTNESATVIIEHQFSEPIEFSAGLFIEEGAGTNSITGIIIGYEE